MRYFWMSWDELTDNQQGYAEAIYVQLCEEQDCVPPADWWEGLKPEEQKEVLEGVQP